MLVMMKPEPKKEAERSARRGLHLAAKAGPRRGDPAGDDGTQQLLQSGAWTIAAGVLAALLMLTVFGGVTAHGPQTNSGWLALIVALMCLPFGSMLFALGIAKWLRNRRLGEGR